MTISTPTPPPDSLPAGPAPAGPNATGPDVVRPTGGDAPGEDFAQFMLAETPAPESAEPAVTVTETTATEQAAVIAASLLWAPLPLLVETTAPTLSPAADVETEAPASAPAVSESDDAPLRSFPSVVEQEGTRLPKKSDDGRAFRPTARDEVSGMNADLPETPAAPLASPVNATAMVNPITVPAQVDREAAPVSLPDRPTADIAAASGETVGTSTAESEVADTSELDLKPGMAAVEPGSVPPVSLTVERAAPRRPARSIVVAGKEKIAAPLNPTKPDGPAPDLVRGKTFVSNTQQEVRKEEAFVGTTVAQGGSAMPSAPADHLFSGEPLAAAMVPPVPAGANSQPGPFDPGPATEPVQQARDTVAAVLLAVDAQEKPESAGTRTVNLDFNFGEERLAVRVEFRDGTVQAHFRTQSAELRTALAHEWQQAAAAPENVLRLAEPVFVTASRGEPAASFNADGGASQQQAQSRPSAPEFYSRPAPAGSRSSTAADTPEAPRPRQLPTALHLQAVA